MGRSLHRRGRAGFIHHHVLESLDMTTPWPPEELDAQVSDKQCGVEFQLFTSLLRFGSGWFANHALQRTDQTNAVRGPLVFLPVLFGFIGLIASVGYQAQRSGAFLHSFYSLDRFIQHHLDAIAGFSSLVALLGIVAGLVILRLRGQSLLVKWGTIFSVVVLLWTVFGLSL
ncbi:MAG: hypothetical protein EXS35_17085 [Pedosphaera sp.]|nr:hypothetical protein [Pedosphaera sp.]